MPQGEHIGVGRAATSQHGPIAIHLDGPIAVVTYTDAATDAQYRTYLAEMTDTMYRQGERYRRVAVINDARQFFGATANQRRMQSEWMQDHVEFLQRKTAGIGFVITSGLVRGGLTAILWLSPLPAPHRIFKDLEPAMAWARGLLNAETAAP